MSCYLLKLKNSVQMIKCNIRHLFKDSFVFFQKVTSWLRGTRFALDLKRVIKQPKTHLR